MSHVTVVRIAGDTAAFRQFVTGEGAVRMREASERARSQGCLHHRFAIGDGEVIAVDEWESAEAFESFFSDPALAQLILDAGGRGEPQVTIAEAISTGDEF